MSNFYSEVEKSADYLALMIDTECDEQHRAWMLINAIQLYTFFLAIYDARYRCDPNFCFNKQHKSNPIHWHRGNMQAVFGS